MRREEPAPLVSQSMRTRSRHDVAVAVPYRLDLTVSVLRRLSTNVVDVLTREGEYVHAFGGAHGPIIARVAQVRPDALTIAIEGEARAAAEHPQVLALVGRMLGIDRDIAHFTRAAKAIRWLSPLARRMRGVKPPRYPTLWEAVVNAIAFQQVSLQAASTIVRRLIVALGTPLKHEGTPLYLFPRVERVLGATNGALRAAGLSAGKIATLRRAGEALGSGSLAETMLENQASAEAAMLLQEIKGIGPWTATLIVLRGLGRLDVFPMQDTSVARNLTLVAGDVPIDVPRLLTALSPEQGMLYYHLLLARLEARGEVGRASISAC